MAGSDAEMEEQAYEAQRKILNEEGAGGEQQRASGTNVEVRVSPGGGVVVRIACPGREEECVREQSHPVPCACASKCAKGCAHAFCDWIATLPFTSEQERIIQHVVSISQHSRDQIVERLAEIVAARLITEEAERWLSEARQRDTTRQTSPGAD